MAADPSNSAWQYDLWDSAYMLGRMLQKQGDLDGALAEFRTDEAIAERLAARDPDNVQWQFSLSESRAWIGEVLAEKGDLSAAIPAYQASIESLEQLTERASPRPKILFLLSERHVALAKSLFGAGNAREARRHMRRAWAIVEPLDPFPYRLYALASAYATIGDVDDAFQMLTKAVDGGFAEFEKAESDPDLAPLRDDPRWRPLLDRMQSGPNRQEPIQVP